MPNIISPEQQIAQAYLQLQNASANPPPPQPQQGSAVQAQIPLPGQLQQPDAQAPNPNGGMPYAGGTPQGGIRSTPQQATADTLNILENRKDIEGKKGDVESETLAKVASKQGEAAAERLAQAADFQHALEDNNSKYEDSHKQTQQAYEEYRKAAGNLKDPTNQFWEDRGVHTRIMAGLAAAASGLGAGLLGSASNPFLDTLHKEIEGNYQAHKQNIEDLYNSSVAAGKIQDSVENHNRFMQDAKLKSYELASMHISHELEGIKNSGASQLAKLTAGQAQAGLDQEGVLARQNLSTLEAQRAAAAKAGDRARQKEIMEQYTKFLEMHNKDMGEDEARQATVKDLQGAGYNISELAPLLEGVGVKTDPATGQPQYTKSEEGQSQEPFYDEAGKLVVPNKSSTGKRIDQKEQEDIRNKTIERTATIDGKPLIFRRKEDAEAAGSISEATRLHQVMRKAWEDGDKGAYDQARSQFIEMAPKLLGYKRGPSEAQAGGIDKGALDEKDRATIAGQLPEFNAIGLSTPLGRIPIPQGVQSYVNNNPSGATNSQSGVALHKLAGVKDTIEAIRKDALASVVNPPKPEKVKAEDLPKSQEELAKKKGWKPL